MIWILLLLLVGCTSADVNQITAQVVAITDQPMPPAMQQLPVTYESSKELTKQEFNVALPGQVGSIYYDKINDDYYVMIETSLGLLNKVAKYDKEYRILLEQDFFIRQGIVQRRSNTKFGQGTQLITNLTDDLPEIIRLVLTEDFFWYAQTDGTSVRMRKIISQEGDENITAIPEQAKESVFKKAISDFFSGGAVANVISEAPVQEKVNFRPYQPHIGDIFYDQINQKYYLMIAKTLGVGNAVAVFREDQWLYEGHYYSQGVVYKKGSDVGNGAKIIDETDETMPQIIRDTFQESDFTYIDDKGQQIKKRKI